jgi:virulence factor Mce-like protein
MAFGRTPKSERPRTLRKDRTGANPFTVGLLTLVAIGLVSYLGFTKDLPFSRGFEFKAVFTSANSIRLKSPVRIAGVNVGSVTKVEGQPGTNNAVITMEMKDSALPIHKDAELKIRPRIFLEGNFFVDLEPGTPSAPTISDGDTIPVKQTAIPVQFDQVLTALQQDTRVSLQGTLREFGRALTATPTPAEDALEPDSTKGKNAAQALNSALVYGGPALRDSAIVQTALQGEEPSDLTGLVQGLAGIGRQLAPRQQQLGELVENFNTTMAALAAEQAPLRESVALLGPTVATAYSALGSLDQALPAVREFAVALTPGLQQVTPTIEAVEPWIPPARTLVSDEQLGGLLEDLQPATASLALATADSVDVLEQGGLLARCFYDVILPVGDVKLDDGQFSSGKPNYQEFWYAVTGQAGEGQNIDGNGRYIRAAAGGGANLIGLQGGTLTNKQPLFANLTGKPLGTKPAWPGAKPPAQKLDEPCYKQPIPDFANTPVGPPDRVGG